MYKIGLIGGHLTPAVAVIEELVDKFSIAKQEIVFFGKKREFGEMSVEYRTLQKLGIVFVPIYAVKINRFLSFKNFLSVFLFPISLLSNFMLLIKYRPQVLVGFGGYLSLPICLAGKLLGIKIIIHEGTINAGVANKIINKIAKRTLISFENSAKYLSHAELIGSPLRREIYVAQKICSNIPMLFVCGGHSGSQIINKNVLPIIEKLLENYIVVHQVGELDFEKTQEFKRRLPANLRVKYQIANYFSADEFARYLVNSEIIISRAGINTVAEILYHMKKTIFIPIPFSQNNEQTENAYLAVNRGVALIIKQKELTPQRLFEKINELQAKDSVPQDAVYRKQCLSAAHNFAKIIVNEIT